MQERHAWFIAMLIIPSKSYWIKTNHSASMREISLKLAIEMYKVKFSLCPRPFQDLFTLRERGKGDFVVPKINTVNRGEETVRYRGPKTWDLVPSDIKSSL